MISIAVASFFPFLPIGTKDIENLTIATAQIQIFAAASSVLFLLRPINASLYEDLLTFAGNLMHTYRSTNDRRAHLCAYMQEMRRPTSDHDNYDATSFNIKDIILLAE